MLTGMRGRHIFTLDETVILKNIDELVQDREAIWFAETWPPIRAMWMAKPPTQWATKSIFTDGPCNSRILPIAAKRRKK